MSRTLRYLLVVGGGVISILLFLLASASENEFGIPINQPVARAAAIRQPA